MSISSDFALMKTMGIGELKAHFSEVLDEVAHGHPVVVARGKKREKLAVIISYSQYTKETASRKLGVMEGRATYRTRKDFKISDQEFLKA